MSAIDIQNAKQIRDPMDVLITLSLGTDIAMTYSGYSSAKVADGVLNQSSWPMRGLADLQGNGFPLDGSRVLYNPNTSPSQTNGKLGVRGNVGQPVSVTATGAEAIAALAISVTGAASVTLSGRTTEITGNRVTLQLLNTTAALTFQPSSEDRRVEIITVLPEADFVINNDNLIKATVSLRSDLSIIDPTLPESELNVEVYQDLDISEAVASIPEDTPITYQAGYPGDMSPVRKFYVSGQVTWKDNVLSIHAVDAVHFLEKTTPASIAVGDPQYYSSVNYYPSSLTGFYRLLYYLLTSAGVTVEGYDNNIYDASGGSVVTILEKETARNIIAILINNLHQDINLTTGATSFWLTYVDAGRPKISVAKPSTSILIREEDCTTIKKNVEREITGFTGRWANDKVEAFYEDGPSWEKNIGIFTRFDSPYIISCEFDFDYQVTSYGASFHSTGNVYEGGTFPGASVATCGPVFNNAVDTYGAFLLGDDIPKGTIVKMKTAPPHTITTNELYTQIVPWSAEMARQWNDVVTGDNSSVPTTSVGRRFKKDYQNKIYGQQGNVVEIEDGIMWGRCIVRSNTGRVAVVPDGAYESLLKRSNITCSFTWKGDPRIQPRDVFTFHRLDGTDEEWTFENITITHEGGGTLAEVTARKGIV